MLLLWLHTKKLSSQKPLLFVMAYNIVMMCNIVIYTLGVNWECLGMFGNVYAIIYKKAPTNEVDAMRGVI